MEIRSIKIDFDKDMLEINGKKAEKPVIVTLPGPDGWLTQKMFNPEIKPYEEYGRITVTINKTNVIGYSIINHFNEMTVYDCSTDFGNIFASIRRNSN